ncbi:MAG: hypothetical protein L0Y72_10955 [Gemmataceae bacterium]|nr:hypothetical protein [Gemmataceae bacterium]
MGTDKWGHFFQQGYWLHWHSDGSANELEGDENRSAFCDFLEGNFDINNPPERVARIIGIREHSSGFFRRSVIREMEGLRHWNMGMHGSVASGVISHADILANKEGYKFYKDLVEDFDNGSDRYVFRIRSFATRSFNESVVTPNTFVNGVFAVDNNTPTVSAPILWSGSPGGDRMLGTRPLF